MVAEDLLSSYDAKNLRRLVLMRNTLIAKHDLLLQLVRENYPFFYTRLASEGDAQGLVIDNALLRVIEAKIQQTSDTTPHWPIFEDSPTNQETHDMSSEMAGVIVDKDMVKLGIPEWLPFTSQSQLDGYHSSLTAFLQTRSYLIAFQPTLASLLSAITYPKSRSTANVTTSLRQTLNQVHDLQADISLLESSAEIVSLNSAIEAAIQGDDAVNLHIQGASKSDAPSSPKSTDSHPASRPASPGADRDTLPDAPTADPGNPATQAFVLYHPSLDQDPVERDDQIWGMINHDYGTVISALKRGMKIHLSLKSLVQHANKGAEKVRFTSMLHDWESDWPAVWEGCGGDKYW